MKAYFRVTQAVKIAACAIAISITGVSANASSAKYPDDYSKTINASHQENGLLIYGNIAEYNWRFIVEGFQKKYPWINVEIADLGPTIGFERYYAESSVDKHTADLIASAAPDAWRRFASKGELVDYQSPETGDLPDWSHSAVPGLYTISTDPMIIIYNKIRIQEEDRPDSLADLKRLAAKDPEKYINRFTTYDALSHSFAYDIHWAVGRHLGKEAGSFFRALGAVTRPESGGSTMVEKVTSGEYWVGYFSSGITVFPRMSQAGRNKILGWALIEDGTPVFHRNIGVTRAGKSPNSAKLMLDYVLSHEGQVAVGSGGLTPYRSDVTGKEVPYLSYQSIQKEIGEENIIHVDYDSGSYDDDKRKTFMKNWRTLYRLDK